MRRSMTALALSLVLLLAAFPLPGSAADYDPADIDRMFLAECRKDIRWERTVYNSGMQAHIYEKTRLDGHECEFFVFGDGSVVNDITLYGSFRGLQAEGGRYRDTLEIYSACLRILDLLIPTGDVSVILSPDDIYYILLNSRIYRLPEKWRILAEENGFIQLRHDCGAYLTVSYEVNDFFTFTYQPY